MAWDKTKPSGATKVRLADEMIRDNYDCLDDALSRNHTFPGVKSDTAMEHEVTELRDQAGDAAQEAGLIKFWNNAGALNIIYPGGGVVSFRSIPGAEIIVFEKDTVVAGFTLKIDKDDFLLFVTKGSVAGGESGGGDHSTGTWTAPTHALTIAEIPTHRHSYTYTFGASFWYEPTAQAATAIAQSSQNTVNTGSDTAHGHGVDTWRPKSRCFTRQEKN